MTIMEHVNGHGQRGRIAPALPEHTFKDSGVTIHFHKIGPSTQQKIAQQIMREMPEPQPPTVDTELGPEANAADPAYLAARDEWQQTTGRELSERLMLIAALEAEVTIDDRARADIARRKRSLTIAKTPHGDNPDLTAEENEKVFYILHVAASSPEDLREFGSAILRRSVPTEEAVQTHVATFQRDV